MSSQSNPVAMLSKTKFSDAPTTRPLCPGSKKRGDEMTLHFLSLFKLNCFTQNIFSLSLFEIEIKFSRLSSFLVSLSFLSKWFYKNFFLRKRKKIEKEGQRRNSWQLDIKWTFAEVKGLLCLTPSLSISLLHAHPHIHTHARTPAHSHTHALSHSNSHMVLSSPFAIIIRAFTVKINSLFSFAQIRPHNS